MYNYDSLKKHHGNFVSQTIDSPIMIFDFWELSEAFAALFIILVFGVIFYMWGVMLALLILCLGAAPVIRSNNNRGIFFHYPYRHWKVSLPGLVNPKPGVAGRRKFSD